MVAVLLCGLALTRDPSPNLSGADDFDGRAVSETNGTTAEPSTGGPSQDAGSGSPSPTATVEAPPRINDARRAEFSGGDGLPDGSRIYDNPSVSVGMAVTKGLLQHGPPRGPVALSSLETELSSDVRKIGARVRFVGDDAGSVVLVAWQSSFVDSRLIGQPIPPTGLRLVAGPGTWELTASPGDQVIGSGSFTRVQGTAAFEVYRRDAEAWVVDPSGTISHFEDPRIEDLAGPWVCWQLLEEETTQTPATIEAVWAG